MTPPSALAWSFSPMLSLSSLSPSDSAVVKLGLRRFEYATKTSSDHLSPRIQVTCGSAVAVAVSTSRSTSVSGSSGSTVLNNIRGNSSSLDIIGNVLESFDTVSTRRQEIREENDTQLKIALPLGSGQHLYEFNTYHTDNQSDFGSCLAPFSEQLHACFSPSTSPRQLSLCTNPTISRETKSENQEITSSISVTDVVALAKAAVEAARDVAVLVEAQAHAEDNDQKSFVYATEPSHPLSAEKDNINKMDMLVNSQLYEMNLAGVKFSQWDDQHSQSATPMSVQQLDLQHSQSATSMSIPLNMENVNVRSNRRMERKTKRNKVSQKVKESASGFLSFGVDQKGKKPVIASSDPKDPVPSVLEEPDSGKLLSAEEEVELSQRVQDLLNLEIVKSSLQEQLGREPTSIEWAKAVDIDENSLKSRIKTGRRCKDKMIKSNLRLVTSVAKHYQGCGPSLPDLIQAGIMGLVKGVEKFDHKRGFKFSTYAHWWIRQAVTKYLYQRSKIIRFPVYYAEVLSRIREASNLLYQEHGRDPSAEELAEVVGISVQRLRKITKSAKTPKSLDQPAGKGQDTKFGEILANTDDENPESAIMKRLLKQDVDRLLRTLTPREREVIRLRHGLDGGRIRTLDEIGHTFKISRERTRQIELTAMRKLRVPGKINTLRNHLGTL